jgi:hypothetical protein
MTSAVVALVVFLASTVRAESCAGLGCSLVGDFLWTALEPDEIALRLNVTTEEADSATGEVSRGGVVEPVNASLAFSRGGREALLTWSRPSNTTTSVGTPSVGTWSAFILGASPNSVWLHGGGGVMVELSRAPLASAEAPDGAAAAAAADANVTAGTPAAPAVASTTTLTVQHLPDEGAAGGGELGAATVGELHRLRSRSSSEGELCLVASTEEAPHFGPCATENALWEVARGKSKGVRCVSATAPTCRAHMPRSRAAVACRRCVAAKARPLLRRCCRGRAVAAGACRTRALPAAAAAYR